jgi:hypothetical protein
MVRLTAHQHFSYKTRVCDSLRDWIDDTVFRHIPNCCSIEIHYSLHYHRNIYLTIRFTNEQYDRLFKNERSYLYIDIVVIESTTKLVLPMDLPVTCMLIC